MTMTYRQVHIKAARERGKPPTHKCIGCGNQAAHWAYQYNGNPELRDPDGRPYSEDIYRCYAPMCIGCHSRLDGTIDKRVNETRRRNMAKVNRRRAGDPHYAAISAANARKATASIQKRREDPEFDKEYLERMRVMGKKGAEAGILEWRRNNPEKAREQASANGKKISSEVNARRRRCLDCSMEAHPGSMGMHLRASGHSGYEDL